MGTFTTYKRRPGFCTRNISLSDSVCFQPDGYSHSLKMHSNHSQTYINTSAGSYSFNCNRILELIEGTCRKCTVFFTTARHGFLPP